MGPLSDPGTLAARYAESEPDERLLEKYRLPAERVAEHVQSLFAQQPHG
jgi:hypothetical protein